MNKFKILFWICTGLLTFIMLISVGMYLFNSDVPKVFYANMGFPIYIMYPLALAKALGLLAIWIKKSRPLTEWAYAGFFFNTLLALSGHFMINDGNHYMAMTAFFAVIGSYYSYRKLFT